MNIDLRFQDWSLVLQAGAVRQYDDNVHTLRVTGGLPAGWRWTLYAAVFGEAYFNSIPLTESDGALTALLTRDDLAFGDTTYTLQLVGEQGNVRRHTNPVRLYVGASLSGDGVWPELPRSFTEAVAAAEAAAARAEAADAETVKRLLADMLIPILREGLYGTDQAAAIDALAVELGGTPEPVDPIETYTPSMSDGYINVTTGATGGTSSYKHTEMIPVRPGDRVFGSSWDTTYSTTRSFLRVRFTAAYDENGAIYPSGGNSTQTDYSEDAPLVVPAGVYGVVFSIVNSLANDVVVYVDKSGREAAA